MELWKEKRKRKKKKKKEEEEEKKIVKGKPYSGGSFLGPKGRPRLHMEEGGNNFEGKKKKKKKKKKEKEKKKRRKKGLHSLSLVMTLIDPGFIPRKLRGTLVIFTFP